MLYSESLRATPNLRDAPAQNISGLIFGALWIAVLIFIAYNLLKSCFERRPGSSGARPPRRPGSTPSPEWFSGGGRPSGPDTPPPYTKYPSQNPSASAQEPGWRPGFWTGAALGGLGAHLLNRRQDQPQRPVYVDNRYDWERDRQPQGSFFRSSPFSSSYSTQRRTTFRSDDRGEGPSNLGPMRRSTGIGGSTVR